MKTKKLWFFILLILFFSNLSAALISHLKFEDNFEDSYGDINGKGINGTAFSSGIEGRSAYFDGSNDYIDLGDANYIKHGDFDPRGADNSYSISMWVYSTEQATSSNANSYIGKHNSTGGTNIFLFGYWNNQLSVRVRGNVQYISAAGNEPVSEWVHYVVTAKESGSNTSAKVYKDGVQIWSGTITDVMGTYSTDDLPWVLGQDWDSGPVRSDHFKGKMDNIRFYDTEIDANYVQQIYLKESSLVHYTFDDNLEDSGPNGYDGTNAGDAGFDFGMENRSLSLDGSYYSFAELGNFDPRGNDGVNGFSISMWVKSDVQATSSENNCYIGKHTSSGGNIFLFGYWGGALKIQIKNQVATVTTVAEPTTWTHYVIVGYENDIINTTELTVFKNGEELWTGTLNDRMGTITGTGHKKWVVGQDWDGSTPTDRFDGKIDNVRFYNRQLSLLYADEVQQLYLSEFSGLRYCNVSQYLNCTTTTETDLDLSDTWWFVQIGLGGQLVPTTSIESIKVSEGWEAYLCPSTNNQGTCHYFDDGVYASGGELPDTLVNSTYSITVQPKTFDYAKKYFGYKKVGTSGNLPVGFAYFYQYPDYAKPTKANDYRRLFMDSENRYQFSNMSNTILGAYRTTSAELFGNVYASLRDNSQNDKDLTTSHRNFGWDWRNIYNQSVWNFYPALDFRDYNDNVKNIYLYGKYEDVGSVGWFAASDVYDVEYVCLKGADDNSNEGDYLRIECASYLSDFVFFEQGVSDDEFYERIYSGNKQKFEHYADNYDLLMLHGHGDFSNGTYPFSYVAIPYGDYGTGIYFTANENSNYSKKLGNSITKWVEIISCRSMGEVGDGWLDPFDDVGDAYYNVLKKLNGVGGFRNETWLNTGPYDEHTYEDHWDYLLRDNMTVSDAWVTAWSEDGSIWNWEYWTYEQRDARFLTLENCDCTLSSCTSYMKNDYFFNVQTGPMPQKTTLTGYNYYCFRDREPAEFSPYTRNTMMMPQEESYPEEFAAYSLYSVPDKIIEELAEVEIGGKETKSFSDEEEYTYEDEWVRVKKSGKDLTISMNRKLESFEYDEDWEYTAKDKFEEAKAIAESLTTLDLEYAGISKDVNEAFAVNGNGESLGKNVNSIRFVFRPKIDGLPVFIEDITVDYDAAGLQRIKSRTPYSISLSRKGKIKSEEEAVAEMAEKVKIEEAENGKVMYALDENYELSLSYMTGDKEKRELKTISLEAKDEK